MARSVLYLNMDQKLKNLKGSEGDIHLGEIIANAIAGCGADNCKGLKLTKLVGWAEKLAEKEPVPLDETDFDSFREFVGLLPGINILALSQADACFRAAKDQPST